MDSMFLVQSPCLFWSKKYFEKHYSKLRLDKDNLELRTVYKSVYLFQSDFCPSPIISIGRPDYTAAGHMRRYNNNPLNRLTGGMWDALWGASSSSRDYLDRISRARIDSWWTVGGQNAFKEVHLGHRSAIDVIC
jgi:hypothetical protein